MATTFGLFGDTSVKFSSWFLGRVRGCFCRQTVSSRTDGSSMKIFPTLFFWPGLDFESASQQKGLQHSNLQGLVA